MVDADVVVLETVIGTGELMPLFAEGSCATAVSVWLPLESAVVSNKIEYGVDVSLAPTFAPSTWNCTNETALSESVAVAARDRKSTRLNSSHRCISYAVFCLKKKKNNIQYQTIKRRG